MIDIIERLLYLSLGLAVVSLCIRIYFPPEDLDSSKKPREFPKVTKRPPPPPPKRKN